MADLEARRPVFTVPTPFDRSLAIDLGALDAYLDFMTVYHKPALLINGTTSEFCSLSLAERKRVLESCRRRYNGRIVAHVGSCCLQDCLELVDHARHLADALLVLPPFYFKNVRPGGLLQFLRAVASASPLPVYLYNFPEHTGLPLTLPLVRELVAAAENVTGIKDSGGDLDAAQELRSVRPGFRVFVGSESLGYDALVRGLDGVVAGSGNPLPEILLGVAERFRAADLAGAEALQRLYKEWAQLRRELEIEPAAAAKAGLGERIADYPLRVRPPLEAADETATQRLRRKVRELRERAADLIG